MKVFIKDFIKDVFSADILDIFPHHKKLKKEIEKLNKEIDILSSENSKYIKLKSRVKEIRALINDHDKTVGDLYYKPNKKVSRYCKSELKSDIKKVIGE